MKLIWGVLLCMLLALPALAANPLDVGQTGTSLSNVSTTGAGTVFQVGGTLNRAPSKFTAVVTVSGQPTSGTVLIEGSDDATTFFTIGKIDTTDNEWVSGKGEMLHITGKSVPYIRCNISAIVPNGQTASCRITNGGN